MAALNKSWCAPADMFAKVDNLVLLVANLQSELRDARRIITTMRDEAKQIDGARASISSAEIEILVQAALDAQRQTRDEETRARREDVSAQVLLLQQEGMTPVLERISRLEDAAAAQGAQYDELVAMRPRLDALELRLDLLACENSRADADKKADVASPAGSDAPPTQTLISFSSPAATPLRSTAIAADSRPCPLEREIQLGTPGCRALPSHMIAAATSAARRRAAPCAAQPESPVPLPDNAFLGKHGRSSDVSESSVNVEADATAACSGSRSPTALNSTTRMGPSASSHAYKRARLGAPLAVTGPINGQGRAEADEDRYTEDGDEEDAREYTVRTKTGSSPVMAKSTQRRNFMQDPSFFATRPVSPCARPARSRASSAASNADENVGPPTGRKSLPLSELPFPLISPYRAPASMSSVPTPKDKGETQRARPVFGRPTNPASDGSDSSKHGFGNFFSGLDRVNRTDATRRASFFAPLNTSATQKQSNHHYRLPPPTPPASRTLFGTEFADNRFGDADGAEAEEEQEGEDPIRHCWGAFAP